MHISTLYGDYSCGSFGKEAKEFIDFLSDTGFSVWQVLPFGTTDECNSPYKSYSAFGGNPYFVDLNKLYEKGYITYDELNRQKQNTPYSCEYKRLFDERVTLLCDCARNVSDAEKEKIEKFIDENNYLADFCKFMALKSANSDTEWQKWQNFDIDEKILFGWKFIQYEFFNQWQEIKKYANEKNISIIGDIPIYVALDSADAWAEPQLFQFDEELNPVAVAGCPPDAFSATGQLWGNPLYRWEYHRQTGYAWWMQRIAYCYQLYDVLRIDHFRGFDEYWFVPYGDPTAENGHWEKGPGYELFDVMKKKLGRKKVIAEDLGFLTPSVIRLVKKTGYPGMKILQFAFDAGNDSEYLPHNYDKNCVVYTGTHDNDTTVGFLQNMPEKDKKFAKKYLGHKNDKKLCFEIIRAALSSCADTAIIPMQDYLELDSSARINTPSTLGCNWKWRMDKNALDPKLAKKIYKMAKLYARV